MGKVRDGERERGRESERMGNGGTVMCLSERRREAAGERPYDDILGREKPH